MTFKKPILKKSICSFLSSAFLAIGSGFCCTHAMECDEDKMNQLYFGSELPPRNPTSNIELPAFTIKGLEFPTRIVNSMIHIDLESLKHICHGNISRDMDGYVNGISGGHLFKYKEENDKLLRESRYKILENDIRKKTYFNNGYDELGVYKIIIEAMKKSGIPFRCDANGFSMDVNMNKQIGSKGERYLRLFMRYDSESHEYSLASAYPVREPKKIRKKDFKAHGFNDHEKIHKTKSHPIKFTGKKSSRRNGGNYVVSQSPEIK